MLKPDHPDERYAHVQIHFQKVNALKRITEESQFDYGNHDLGSEREENVFIVVLREKHRIHVGSLKTQFKNTINPKYLTLPI